MTPKSHICVFTYQRHHAVEMESDSRISTNSYRPHMLPSPDRTFTSLDRKMRRGTRMVGVSKCVLGRSSFPRRCFPSSDLGINQTSRWSQGHSFRAPTFPLVLRTWTIYIFYIKPPPSLLPTPVFNFTYIFARPYIKTTFRFIATFDRFLR